MKLKDLKDKNGKGLLPEKRKSSQGRINFAGNLEDTQSYSYNQAISEIGEKELTDYIEVDVSKVAHLIDGTDSSIPGAYTPKALRIAHTISKADIWRVK